MKVAIALPSAHRHHYKLKLKDFHEGIRKCGDESFLVDRMPDPRRYDTAVIYGSFKTYRTSLHHKIKNSISTRFKKFVQFETPVIGRNARITDHEHVRAGVNGFLWDEAKWGFEYIDQERYKKVFAECGVDPNVSWKQRGDDVVICMQNPGDASLRGKDIFEWCEETIIELKKHTDRRIVIRPHPLPRHEDERRYKVIEKTFDNVEVVQNMLPNNLRPLEDDFNRAWCVVTFSSGSAVDAVLAGIPNIACDTGNMAYEVSSRSLSDVESPYMDDKLDWIKKISMCQYSKKELADGTCWQHIRKSI